MLKTFIENQNYREEQKALAKINAQQEIIGWVKKLPLEKIVKCLAHPDDFSGRYCLLYKISLFGEYEGVPDNIAKYVNDKSCTLHKSDEKNIKSILFLYKQMGRRDFIEWFNLVLEHYLDSHYIIDIVDICTVTQVRIFYKLTRKEKRELKRRQNK
jgi:hypothetical protein